MVEGVLTLDKRLVTTLMTPRPKIVFLNLDDPEEVNWRKIVTSGHSYFPVYQGHRDQIVGMVAVKALWAHSAIGLPTTLKNLLLPPLLVPEKMTANHLLEQFKKTGKHIAVVTDEFGAVQGLITLIDVPARRLYAVGFSPPKKEDKKGVKKSNVCDDLTLLDRKCVGLVQQHLIDAHLNATIQVVPVPVRV